MTRLTRRLSALASGLLLIAPIVLCHPAAASAAGVTAVRKVDLGVIEAGATKTRTTTISGADLAHATAGGFRVTDQGGCLMAVTETSYSRTAIGVRSLTVTVRNDEDVACDSFYQLAMLTAEQSGTFGVLEPGASKTSILSNAKLGSRVYLAGVTPDVASTTCRMRVDARTRALSDGQLQFYWVIRNIGTVACGGQWRLGWLPVDDTYVLEGYPFEGENGGQLFHPASGPFRVYVSGFNPIPDSAGTCTFATVEELSVGSPETRPHPILNYVITNAGSRTCMLHNTTVARIL